MKDRLLAILVYGIAAFLCGLRVSIGAESPPNNGEDLTRPLDRVDVRFQFQTKPGGIEQSTVLLRSDYRFELSRNWRIAGRLDLPLVQNNSSSADNPAGESRGGMGDVLAQLALIHDFSERVSVGVGLRVQFPTASEDQFGSGKYRLIPLLGVRIFLPEISKGSFFQPVVRYDFDAAGGDGRSHISQWQFSPTLNLALPARWFITLFPSQDIVYNNIGGKWFIPADFLVGRNLTEHTIASVEVSIPALREFTLYDSKLEARFSYSF